jgi:hypothetical protein
MRAWMLTGVAVLALAGCSKSETKEEATKAEAAALKREPGLWKSNLALTKVEMPGAPAGMEDQLKQMASKVQSVETCLTPEDAAKEDLAEKLAKPPGEAGDCVFSKKDVSGGNLNVVMECKNPQGGEPMKVTMTGTASSKKTDVVLNVSGKDGAQALNMEMHATNEWTGPCKS